MNYPLRLGSAKESPRWRGRYRQHARRVRYPENSPRSQSPPCATIAREQFIRFFGSPGAGRIKKQGGSIFFCDPCVFDDVDERPSFLHFVAAREEGGVAAHGIEQ